MVNTTLRIGPLELPSPVVLAPMAGVTNAPFRSLCREFAPGLLYVNEMVMATALVHGSAKTERMVTFAPGESPRSLQLYGSDPRMLSEAVKRLGGAGAVDHIDMNFGCPAAKVTRKGGGAAVPAKPNLLRAIMSAAVEAAAPYGIPVTAKFRKGIDDDLITYLETGRIAVDTGIAAIALHARTAQQHYSGEADWDAIAALKHEVRSIPVLGNGDIWTADDALRMVAHTGCDGVVVGRGCLGRPWLFGDLVDAFAGRQVAPPRRLGFVVEVMKRHVRALDVHFGTDTSGSARGVRDFRKHVSWYLTGFPVGGDIRHRLATTSTVDEVDRLLDEMLDTHGPELSVVDGGERIR
ncbi:MAG: tRNA dihydrouridine synthase DusB, partial [Actinobacteria bacterium]|nr:tRNA dihydrouridine synthase DusB [Actinomycetota bacterium]